MADGRKGMTAAVPRKPAAGSEGITTRGADEEATIKVASKKDAKDAKANGVIKLKKPAPKHKLPGNWKDGAIIDRMHLLFSSLLTFYPPSPAHHTRKRC